MAGQYVLIRDRWTYFPPFQNERLTKSTLKGPDGASLAGKPFWSCTFTALMYGINYGYLGNPPAHASQEEIVALAIASGDTDLRGGGTTTLMRTALQVKYNQAKAPEASGPQRVAERLAAGEMLVAGLRSKDLSAHFRRFIGNGHSLHRAAFVGFRTIGGKPQTRILDPMAVPSKKRYDPASTYAGEWFPLADYVQAAFSNEQLWFRAGEFLDRVPLHPITRFDPPGTLTVKAGTTLVGVDRRRPERKVLQVTFAAPAKLAFDIHLHATVGGQDQEYLSIAGGPFDTLLVRRDTPGLTANIPAAPPTKGIEVLPDLPIVEVPDDPGDVAPPGTEAPPEGRSTPIDLDLDDDPLDVDRPEEDATAEAAP
jgi:hypothetical protein